ncbi:MAG: DEAD/DEAH box helicase, partial [Nitrospinota bacterium]
RPESHAVFIYPLKALARDQLKTVKSITSLLTGHNITVGVYDGDTSPYFRKKMKNTPPNILITNPDMLHSAFLPFHSNWEGFLKNLKWIVVDEFHTYRGVFGSHVAQIFRRFNRIANFYRADPVYIASSATIANPTEFSKNSTGKDFSLVAQNGAPDPGRHFLFLNPPVSPYTVSVELIRRALQRGLKTITFTKSRRVTELIHSWLVEKEQSAASRVSSYRSGFLPSERREIETNLANGSIQAVISTSALEVGIDIGGLDICILSGYPGTIINTWQRGGRAGRREEPGLVILLAQHDALDQYFMKNPDDFFKREFEKAVIDPLNSFILRDHLLCAAAELPLSPNDIFFPSSLVSLPLKRLLEAGSLLQAEQEELYFAANRRPHRFVDIRSTGNVYTIIEKETKKIIGTISGTRAFAECHPGAVYLHKAAQYLIDSFDFSTKDIRVTHVSVPYFTKAKTEKETEILETTGSKPVDNFIVRKGRLRVTETFFEYEKRKVSGQVLISTHSLT